MNRCEELLSLGREIFFPDEIFLKELMNCLSVLMMILMLGEMSLQESNEEEDADDDDEAEKQEEGQTE